MRNSIWLTFLVVVAFAALWFILKAGFGIYSYFQYTVQLPIKIESLEVKELKTDQFAVIANYSFEYQNKKYQNSGKVGSLYPNPWAAERAKQMMASDTRAVWIDPKHPEDPILEKKFPLKRMVSAAILLGLFIYFLVLGTYVKVKHG